ncbi:MAG TPA: UDP-N-acetylmuramate dehydrogenase [Cytophagaceae bacterium]|nr:UDP-N-acetylmuramate dehydrogenase [Cytophagaceae bacterium]
MQNTNLDKSVVVMKVEKDFSLKNNNTFGIEATAKYFIEIINLEELIQILSNPIYKNEKLLILGGGSNLLFTTPFFDGLVLHIKMKGVEISKEDSTHVILKVGAGEIWHELVMYAVSNNWGGMENLSLIPGTVGAAPMQNIGAYGVEIKDIFVGLEAYEIATGKVKHFSLEECKFGYRSSIFKYNAKGQYIITAVSFKLNKQPSFTTSYGAIADTLKEMNVLELSVKAVSDAVIRIRQSKLPDPKEIGNAGSFFKNPEISLAQFNKIKSVYSEIPSYPTLSEMIKVPAGWLIEKCGWKGKIVGHTGVHKNQALVLVNYGHAKGEEIKALSIEIQKSVKEKFDIALETEVNFI